MSTPTTNGGRSLLDPLARYLHALYGPARSSLLIELRLRHDAGMAQRFVPVDRLELVEQIVTARGPDTDVYVGVLPRWRAAGSRRDVAGGARVVWADCDEQPAGTALAQFPSPPSLVVRSGTQGHRHAYWLLRTAATVAEVQRGNGRLAFALGADPQSAEAARILRPPGTFNHKHSPPTAVVLASDAERRYTLHELVGQLPDPPDWRPGAARPRRRRDNRDALRGIDPAVYVQRLTGQRVGRNRKVRCPLHDDAVPSLHVYPDSERGWYCFGCRRGGSIYDLAALLWRRPTSGAEFVALRRDLQQLLS